MSAPAKRDRVTEALRSLDRPVRIPFGETRKCVDCGRQIAGRASAVKLRVRRHAGDGRCEPCWEAARPDVPPKPRPKLVKPDLTWRLLAACAGADPELFDVIDGARRAPGASVRTAIRYCAGCPVRSDCDAEARANHEWGLWGGQLRFQSGDVIDLLDPELWERVGA